MRLFGKPTVVLNKDDVERLISNQVPESIGLDYKMEFPKSNDAGKKELLADISAMANTAGGILIFGLKEAHVDGKNAGYPEQVVGLKEQDGSPINVEQKRQWLDSVIRDGLDPRLQGIEYNFIEYSKDEFVLLVDIPRSLQVPHMVKFQNDSKFYGRTNSGKFQMDVRQIKDSMLRTNDWKTSAEQFRREHIDKLYSYSSTFHYGKTATVVLQVMPLGERESFDIKGKSKEIGEMLPYIADHYSVTYNLDGIIKHSKKLTNSYLQFYRNGGMEAYTVIPYESETDESWQLDLGFITTTALNRLFRYMQLAKTFDINPPFAVFLNVIHVRGAYLRDVMGKHPFAEGVDKILFPDIVIEDLDENIETSMMPIFDMLYQACGKASCSSYDANGKFTLRYDHY